MLNLKGVVISIKMKDTIVVSVAYSMRHPQYGKIIKKITKLSVHNEIDGIALGDVVEVAGSKPYSRTVFFKVVSKIGGTKLLKKEPEPTQPSAEIKVKKEVKKVKAKSKK